MYPIEYTLVEYSIFKYQVFKRNLKWRWLLHHGFWNPTLGKIFQLLLNLYKYRYFHFQVIILDLAHLFLYIWNLLLLDRKELILLLITIIIRYISSPIRDSHFYVAKLNGRLQVPHLLLREGSICLCICNYELCKEGRLLIICHEILMELMLIMLMNHYPFVNYFVITIVEYFKYNLNMIIS